MPIDAREPGGSPLPGAYIPPKPKVVTTKPRNNSPAPRPNYNSNPSPAAVTRRMAPAKSIPPVIPPVMPAKKPTPFDYTKDARYLQDVQGYDAILKAAQSNDNTLISQANQDQTNQLSDYSRAMKTAQDALANDYAARGLANSSLYSDAVAQQGSEQQAQQDSLIEAIRRRIEGYTNQSTDQKNTYDLSVQQAKSRATDRNASAHGG